MRPKSKILPKWIEVRADQLHHDLHFAPGNKRPLPPRRKSRRNMKLELADAEIKRCVYCGSWHSNTKKLCGWCDVNPYPVIDDFERTTP